MIVGVHTNDGSSLSRKEKLNPCGVSKSRKFDLSVILDKTSRRKSSFSSSRQSGVGGEDTIGRGTVGTSTGVLVDGMIAGAMAGTGSRVGSVGPLDGTEGVGSLVSNMGVGGKLGWVRVGRGVIVWALGTCAGFFCWYNYLRCRRFRRNDWFWFWS